MGQNPSKASSLCCRIILTKTQKVKKGSRKHIFNDFLKNLALKMCKKISILRKSAKKSVPKLNSHRILANF